MVVNLPSLFYFFTQKLPSLKSIQAIIIQTLYKITINIMKQILKIIKHQIKNRINKHVHVH